MHTLLLCTSYLSCSFPIRRPVDIFKDTDCLLLWSSDLLAGRLIRSASVARVCVAPAICVSSSWTTLYARVCVWLHAVTSCESVCSCPGCARRLSPVCWCECVLFSERTVNQTCLDHLEHPDLHPEVDLGSVRTTHTVFFSFSIELDTLSGWLKSLTDASPVFYPLSLSQLVTELFVLSPHEEIRMKATGSEYEVNT